MREFKSICDYATDDVIIRLLAKDKIDTEAKRIARTYYSVINSNHPEKRIEQFGSLPGHIRDFELITVDRYTIAQAKHLDNYLKKKVALAAHKKNVPVPAELSSYQIELTNDAK